MSPARWRSSRAPWRFWPAWVSPMSWFPAGTRLCRVAVPLFAFGLEDPACPFLLLLSQAGTERVLGEYLAAAGVRVERGVELAGLSNAADAATATLRHRDGREEVVPARYVAGCDGGH